MTGGMTGGMDGGGSGDGSGTSTGARILVVEDDPVVRFNIACFLEDSDYQMLEAETGAAAITAVHEQAPDLVLCDLRMPEMDGLSVLDAIQEVDPELPVIIVSGTGILADAVAALRAGAWDFVTKPIQDMAVLEHAIVRSLDRSRLVRENRRIHQELEWANRRLRAHLDQLEHDAAAGRTLQQRLMAPPGPLLEAYDFDRHLLPSLYLSGDFVDCFPIDPLHFGFFLADVSGHGVSSAFVTVLLKSMVDRHRDALDREGDALILQPDRLLARLNDDLLAQPLDKYLTIFYGVIDLPGERLTFSNGGQFPPPILVQDETAEFLERPGFPVGLVPGADYTSASVALPRHHRLVLFSDGVLDALPDTSLDARRQRLLEAASRPADSAEQMLAGLGLAAGGAYPDDITLLLLTRAL